MDSRHKQQDKQHKPQTTTTAGSSAAAGTKKPPVSYSAQQKAEAVLSIWSERRGSSEVCRELGIAWTILNQWQQRALEGMLQALQPRVSLDKGPALSPRLQQMLQRKARSAFPLQKLQQRLSQAQQGPQQPSEAQRQP